jgi:hypothetical protein
VPEALKIYISSLFNPPSDGNCGYHCIAKAIGYDNDLGWFRVREEMIKELQSNFDHYSLLLGGKKATQTVLTSIKITQKSQKITKSKWLSHLDHGQIISNAYVRPVAFLSVNGSSTFLPLRVGPPASSCPPPIYLLYVDGSHWVLPNLKPVNGILPLPPIVSAPRFMSEEAKAWIETVQDSCNLYKEIEQTNTK